MYRMIIVVIACVTIGCSDAPTSNNVNKESVSEIEDGGIVDNSGRNSDRKKAERFLAELPKVKTAEEEQKLLTEFGAWLRENDYKIEVTVIDGKHNLSCPYFPPVTPWVRHSFLDSENLELLPRLEGE